VRIRESGFSRALTSFGGHAATPAGVRVAFPNGVVVLDIVFIVGILALVALVAVVAKGVERL